MRIAIIGCGFVGSTVADFLDTHGATDGIEVIRIDPKIEGAPELEDVTVIDAAILCLNAPTLEDNTVDDYITRGYIEQINRRFGDTTPIMVKSTIPMFSELAIKDPLTKKIPDNVVFNPEFLRADHAKEDFENQELFIIGVPADEITHDTPADENTYAKFWTNIFAPSLPNTEFIYTDRETAIMVKYTHNAWLATKVTFFHSLSQKMPGHSNYNEMTDILAKFPNIGPSHMKVPNAEGGLGYSGFCFPKDMNAFGKFTDMELIYETIDTNEKLIKKKEPHSWTSLKSLIPDEDYIICLGTSHTLGECGGELTKSYANFVEEELGIKVVKLGISGASNLDLLQATVELNALGFLNERCKLFLLEPRLTENTIRVSLDAVATDKQVLNHIVKEAGTNLQLNRALATSVNGMTQFPRSIKNIVSLNIGPRLLGSEKDFKNAFKNELEVDHIDDTIGVFDFSLYEVAEKTQSLFNWHEDVNKIEAMQQVVKNTGTPFRWMLVDNRIKELNHVRFHEGKVTDLFKDMLLTKPVQLLVIGNDDETLHDIDQTLLCECGHFSPKGNKLIADEFITPAIKKTLNKFPRSKNDICS